MSANQKPCVTCFECLAALKMHSPSPPSHNLLQGINELPVVDGWSVNDLLDELPVTVGVGCGDVEEDLQVLHRVGQRHHLLGCQNVQLDRVSTKEDKRLWMGSSHYHHLYILTYLEMF